MCHFGAGTIQEKSHEKCYLEVQKMKKIAVHASNSRSGTNALK